MSRLKLTDVEWKKFKISGEQGFFSVDNNKPYHSSDLEVADKGIPYITRTSMNNGLDSIVKKNEHFVSVNGNCISLGAENADFFYQEKPFMSGNKMYSIRNNNMTKNIGLFLVQCFRHSIKDCGFGYGKGLTGTRFKDRYVMLPIDTSGIPNWQFMEDYIKQEQEIKAMKIIAYYEEKMLKTAFDLVGLNNVEWNDYKIGDLFRFERKSSKGLNHMSLKNDGISYLGATNRNNGVLDFVEKKVELLYEGNSIAFIRNGEGSMGYSVYKKEPFIATQDISVGYNENLNQHNGMFITTIADRIRGKYNFGYKRNQQRLESEILQLPTDSDGNPNWDYMSKFMQNNEMEKLSKTLEYIYIYKLAISKGLTLGKLNETEWQGFWIEDILKVSSGTRLTKENQRLGRRPFIGATEYNNGITSFVENVNGSLDSKVLGVNYNGSVVENFYHAYECIFSDDVKRLSWVDASAQNKYTYLFLKQCILQQKIKYAYGYKFNATRMKRQKIILPIDVDGKINYGYMKVYMQIQEIKAQYKVIDFYKNSVNKIEIK